MKKVKLFILCLSLVSIVLCFFMLSPTKVSAATSGATGACTWTLNGTELTISGNGAMDNYGFTFINYEFVTDAPWGTNITKVIIEDGVTSIGDKAFYGCDCLTSVSIGNSVTSIGSVAFYNCDSLTSIDVNKDNQVYKSIDGVLYTKDGTKLIACPGGKTVIDIPNSVTSIGSDAFDGCYYLTSITIPNSVTSIGDSAFEHCISLTSIIIPNSVTSIGSGAFYNCNDLQYNEYDNAYYLGNSTNPYLWLIEAKTKSITSCNINSNTKFIYGDAFCCCDALTSITIPDSVTSIGNVAFSNCSALTSIDVNKDNQVYKSIDGVLYTKDGTELIACPGGKTVIDIPDSVTSIGSDAFSGCSSLTSISIPNSVTSIGDWAFSGCSSLTSITIPDSVTSIDSVAFYNCSNLTSIDVNKDNQVYKSIDGVLYTKDGTELIACPGGKTVIDIPNSVTSIGDEAFYWCSSLTSIVIPDSVTSIGDEAFRDCWSLTSVSIGNSVTSIGDEAFYYCSSLTEIYFEGTKPTIEEYAFSGVTANVYALSENGWSSIDNYGGNLTLILTGKGGTVTFKNYDGTVISSATYNYGDSVTIPDTPTKPDDSTYTYTFAGWDKTVTTCFGDITYTATYTPIYIDYTVTFKNYDNSVLSSETYHYGDSVTKPATPTKQEDEINEYIFAGWDKDVVACDGDATYTATYTQNQINGWKQNGNDWIFLEARKAATNTWAKFTDGNWKYLGDDGVMLDKKVFGDIDDDGDIDNDDIAKLKEFIVNLDFKTGKSTVDISVGADVNLDGTVDGKDVIRLKKYLDNINPDTGKSTIELGK